jgi:hypothetical protein
MARIELSLLLVYSSVAFGAGGSIGTAVSTGSFLLNAAPVKGNATLLDGTLIEATQGSSRLQLTNGARFDLAAGSRAKVYSDRIVFEKGSSDVSLAGSYAIEARSLRISSRSANVKGVIALAGEKDVQLAASNGAFRVHNAQGILVSFVEAGMGLAFQAQAAGGAPSSFVGCVVKKEEKLYVYDPITRMLVELRGGTVDREWGNQIQVNGTARAAAAGSNQQVLDVTGFTRIQVGGCATIAQQTQTQLPAQPAGAAQPAPRSPDVPKASGGGMSAGTKVGIVVAVAGGGAGAALVLSSKSNRSN